MENTKAIVEAFGASEGPGPKLQKLLLQRREEKDNWVSFSLSLYSVPIALQELVSELTQNKPFD